MHFTSFGIILVVFQDLHLPALDSNLSAKIGNIFTPSKKWTKLKTN
jgi:hypothetical protein